MRTPVRLADSKETPRGLAPGGVEGNQASAFLLVTHLT
jgi:hypothetical protein